MIKIFSPRMPPSPILSYAGNAPSNPTDFYRAEKGQTPSSGSYTPERLRRPGDTFGVTLGAKPVQGGENADRKAMSKLENKIAELVRSPKNPVEQTVAEVALKVIHSLPPGVAEPQIKPSVDGDIILLWYSQGDHVEINLDPDGCLSWFGKFSGVYEVGGDTHWTGDLPHSAINMLHRLANER